MWDMNGEDPYAETTRKVHDMIAEKLGWTDLDQMLLNEGEIDDTLRKAINLLCESYKVTKIFK
jgi:hypothetical protein